MNTCARWGATVVVVLGVVGLVFGIIFITQASSAEREIANEIQPLTIAEVDAKYEAVKTNQLALAMTEEPQIRAGKAAPSTMYNYLTVQRTSLGLARANIGLVGFVRTSGIIYIIVGLGLILAGVGLFKKGQRVT
ncbi:hypothetical protein ES703_84136 [subsurface metagenome]